jgi:uncharacterized membrane protein
MPGHLNPHKRERGAAMTEACVVAVYGSTDKAESAVHILHRAGYPAERISLIAATLEGHPESLDDLSMPDDSLRDAAIGAGLGGVVGVLAGISLMAITELGLVFLIGPIGGGFVGAVTGGFVGALSGWGVHKTHLAHYENCLKKGRVLVIAEGDPKQVTRADNILQETDNMEVHVHVKSDSESKEILR